MIENPGQQFGKYMIEVEIGRGGFGTVFRAIDTTLDRPVALKILDPLLMRDLGWVERFRREARLMARLDHPHIVPIYETGTHEGRLFLAMKLIDGRDLALGITENGPFSWEETLTITAQMASALDYAHQQGLVHRDLKPSNILLANGSAVLTDFGLSMLASSNTMSVSMTGGVIGTPSYIAPESWEGRQVTGQADQYALASLVYEMLTGEILFTGKTPPEIMMAHFKDPGFPESWGEEVPPGVAEILSTGLARSPDDRYPSCSELASALQRLQADALARPYAALQQAVREEKWEQALDLADQIRTKDNRYRDVNALEEAALAGLAAAQKAAAAAQWRTQAEQALADGDQAIARMAALKWQELTGDPAAADFLQRLEEPAPESQTPVKPEPIQTPPAVELAAEPAATEITPDSIKEKEAITRHASQPDPAKDKPPAVKVARPQPAAKKIPFTMTRNIWYGLGGILAIIVLGFIISSRLNPVPQVVVEEVEVTRVVEVAADTPEPEVVEIEVTRVVVETVVEEVVVEPEGSFENDASPTPPEVFGIEWIEIPAGPFMMGANEDDDSAVSDESPLHEVTLETFWISRYEITNAQYKEFVDAVGHRVPFLTREDYDFLGDSQYAEFVEPYLDDFNWDPDTLSFPPGRGDHPVTQVSWTDALAYTEWLSEETGLTITLPGEAEWEKAARGDGEPLIFPWGIRFDGSLLNFCDENCEFDWRDPASDDGFQTTAPVKSFPEGASPYGVEDMAGNVWEWTRSEYTDSYPYNFDLESTDPQSEARRVMRGGSWRNLQSGVRTSFRGWYSPDDRDGRVGFRVVVLDPSPR